MENNDKRKYQPVICEMIGVETGLERFSKDGITMLPPVSQWRNNLTALSQHGNLFFIASNDCVAVYQPEFPFQTLRRQPALLIKPNLANSHAPGYLSSRRVVMEDHCINQLMVGDLGSQEILLLATDSGNVVAYLTSSITEAIKRASGSHAESSTADVFDLRPFFSQWVRQSAWGLDIHKEARMIAVSANVPSNIQPSATEDPSAAITVFAFALHDTASSASSSETDSDLEITEHVEWIAWDQKTQPSEPNRDRNYKVTLAGWHGHGHNIPNISFVNTAEDCEGTWLLSTDITGEMKLWQIWKAATYRSWHFGATEQSMMPWMHHTYPGWNVAALDMSCFRPARNNEEFIGASKTRIYHGYHDRGESFDITNIVNRLPGNSQYHPLHPDPNDSETPSDGDQLHQDSEAEEDSQDQPLPMDGVDSSSNQDFDPETESSFSSNTEPESERELEAYGRSVEFRIDMTDDWEHDDGPSSAEDESMEEDTQTSPPSHARTQRLIRRFVTPTQNPNIKPPNIAMIHCTDSHVRLLGSPKARFPHIFCANMLKQILPHNIHTHDQGLEFVHVDRMNMMLKIPELGIVLIGTQTGRVAVCALTRRPDGLLGFRVDWVLPTKKQERRGRRPTLCPLVGIAAAPVQGRWPSQPDALDDDDTLYRGDGEVDGVRTSFDPDIVMLGHRVTARERKTWKADCPEPKLARRPWKRPAEISEWQATEPSRRYRVMITYSDMSVLTYEMSRGIEMCEKSSR